MRIFTVGWTHYVSTIWTNLELKQTALFTVWLGGNFKATLNQRGHRIFIFSDSWRTFISTAMTNYSIYSWLEIYKGLLLRQYQNKIISDPETYQIPNQQVREMAIGWQRGPGRLENKAIKRKNNRCMDCWQGKVPQRLVHSSWKICEGWLSGRGIL